MPTYMNPLLAAMIMEEPHGRGLYGPRFGGQPIDSPAPMAQRPRAAKKPARPGEEEPPPVAPAVAPPMGPMQPPMADIPPPAARSVTEEINHFLSPRKVMPAARHGGLVGSILGSGTMAMTPLGLPMMPLGGLMGGYSGEKIGEWLGAKLGQEPTPDAPPVPPMADQKMPPLTQEARPRPDPREMSITFPPMANRARVAGMPGMPLLPEPRNEGAAQQLRAERATPQVAAQPTASSPVQPPPMGPPSPDFIMSILHGDKMQQFAWDRQNKFIGEMTQADYAGQGGPRSPAAESLNESLRLLGAPSWARGEKTVPQYLWQPQSDPAYATKMALMKSQGDQATELEKARIQANAHIEAQKPSASRLMEGLVAKRLENGLPITDQWLNATRGVVDRLYVQPGIGARAPRPPMSAAAPSAAPAGAVAPERAAAPGGSRDLIPEELTPAQMEAAIKTFHPAEGDGLNVEKLGEVLLANQLLYQNLPGLVQTLKRRTITGDPRTEIANEIMRLMEYRGELQDYAPLPSEMHGMKFSSVPTGNTVLGIPTIKSYALETPKVRQEVPITPGYRWSRNSLVPPMLRLRSTQENYGQRIPLLRQLLEEYGAP